MLPLGGGGVRRLLECLWRQMGACAGVPPRPLHTSHIRGQGTWLAVRDLADSRGGAGRPPAIPVAGSCELSACRPGAIEFSAHRREAAPASHQGLL